MGFKLPGKSIQTGTSAHSSALKMKKESMAKMYKNSPTDFNAKLKAAKDAGKLPDEFASVVKYASPAKETFSQAYRKNRNAGENTFTYKCKSYSTESASEKEKRGGKGEYKNKRAKAKATTEVNTENMADAINAENTKTLEKNNKEKENVTVKVLTKDQLKDKQKEKVADKKDNLKDTKKQNKINTLKSKKDIADAKGNSKRSERLERKIERKETGKTRADQRKERKAKKIETADSPVPYVSPVKQDEKYIDRAQKKHDRLTKKIEKAEDKGKTKKVARLTKRRTKNFKKTDARIKAED